MPDAPHVALFIRSLGGGGAERNWLHLAESLAERGARVDLVLGRRSGAFRDAVPAGVRAIDLGGGQWLRTAGALLRDPRSARVLAPVLLSARPPGVLGAAPALADYLRRERPEVLLSALAYSNVTAIWARRLAGTATRVVVSERNVVSHRAAASRERRWRRLPEVLAHFYAEADAIGAVSDGVADDLAAATGLARARIHTTYSAIVTPSLRPRAAEPPEHPWLRETGGPPVVLAVGKLKRQKGFDVLLEAFARVRKERPAKLLVLGEGPLRGDLEAQARRLGVADDVALPGFASNPYAAMARAQVFVLSSAWEGLPSVLVQAMACGCPVVSTDCPAGPAEILEGGRLAPLVPVGDAAGLARAIQGVLAQPPDTDPLVERAAAFTPGPVLARTWPLLFEAERESAATRRTSPASCAATASVE